VSALAVLGALAEARIEEAMRDGAFDDLPGTGRPLVIVCRPGAGRGPISYRWRVRIKTWIPAFAGMT